MSDQATQVDPAIVAEATALGWIPEEKFTGDKARWVDAATFVERGHTIMPILKKNNQDLLGKLEQARQEAASAKETTRLLSKSMEDLRDLQAGEIKRQVEERLAAAKAELRAARRGDDPELVDALEDQVDKAKERLAELKAPPAPPATPPASQPMQPWAVAFQASNPWFGVDKKRTAVFAAAVEEHFAKGLRETAMAEAAKADMLALFEPAAPPAPDKAEGGGSRQGSGGAPTKTGFDALPADVKAFVKKEAHKFVGPKGKAFKTNAEWEAHYATVYNEGN